MPQAHSSGYGRWGADAAPYRALGAGSKASKGKRRQASSTNPPRVARARGRSDAAERFETAAEVIMKVRGSLRRRCCLARSCLPLPPPPPPVAITSLGYVVLTGRLSVRDDLNLRAPWSPR